MEPDKPYVYPLQGQHTHTFIMLHGRGSTGAEFCEQLFWSVTSQMKNLPDNLPNFRWVFPSSDTRYSTMSQEQEHSWFDIYSITDTDARRELQVDGLRESVLKILNLLSDEIELLGDPRRVFLGGISQGMATALWTFLCAPGRIKGPLGGVVGFCGWLPFAEPAETLIRRQHAEDLLRQYSISSGILNESSKLDKRLQLSKLFLDTIAGPNVHQVTEETDMSVLLTPVFLSHGSDDRHVSVRLFRRALHILQDVGISAEWKEFAGAEAGGHWIKQPEGIEYIVKFIQRQVSNV
jgi:predicted esterase